MAYIIKNKVNWRADKWRKKGRIFPGVTLSTIVAMGVVVKFLQTLLLLGLWVLFTLWMNCGG